MGILFAIIVILGGSVFGVFAFMNFIGVSNIANQNDTKQEYIINNWTNKNTGTVIEREFDLDNPDDVIELEKLYKSGVTNHVDDERDDYFQYLEKEK